MNWLLAALAYVGAIIKGIGTHAGDDINTDEYGMNQTDRDLVAYLKTQVQKGAMTEEEAIEYLRKKGAKDPEKMFGAVQPKGDSLFGESAGIQGTTGGAGIQDIFSSLMAYFTRNQLTGAEMQQNEWNAQEAEKSRAFTEYMTRNKYQMETQSMQQAGVNPAMVYGGGNLVPTTNNTTAASGSPIGAGNIGDLLSTLIRMPRELKLLDAEIAEKRANADLTHQKYETEIANTRIQNINADYQEALNDQNLKNLRISYDDMVAGIDVKTAQKDEIRNKADAQATLNKYLDERERADIDKIKAEKSEIGQKEKYEKAQTTYQNWYNNFVEQNDFLPSSNDVLMLGTYIASLLGLGKDDFEKFIHDMMDPESDMNRKWRARHNENAIDLNRGRGKGGSTAPLKGDASEGSVGAGSR